ncbi:MAG: hypothetical protein IJ729_03860 [Alloprevotella sp.]|nr:hypothetical protein [Alloprevotella sp.]
MVLHVFNPSHDEALAAGTHRYTPSRAAQRLERELAELPLRWASPGDAVLLPGKAVNWDTVERIEPWGWDALLRHRLRQLGAPERLLPSDEALQTLRALSSRATAVRLLPLLRAEVEGTFGESRMCSSEDEVRQALADYGTSMLKSPWSCSGRGVFGIASATDIRGMNRVRRVLRAQGAVEAEPYYAGCRDFAMEFYYSGGELRYEALSLFSTDPTGGYRGNTLAPQEQLLEMLLAPAPAQTNVVRDTLAEVREALRRHLPRLLADGYDGPLGVDMLMRPDGTLHPCLEINLRQTMGRAAWLCHKKGVPLP